MTFYKVKKSYKTEKTTTAVHERRLDRRKPSALQAVIRWEQNQSRRCWITSVSLTGLFLESSEARLTIGTVLQLFFYVMIDGSHKLCSEWVRVVGQRDNGLAVRFIRFDNQHQCNIQLMLQQAVIHPAVLAQPNRPVAVEQGLTQKTA